MTSDPSMTCQFSDREAQRQPRVVGKIDQLFIYPLKSAEGIPISSGYAAEQAWIQAFDITESVRNDDWSGLKNPL